MVTLPAPAPGQVDVLDADMLLRFATDPDRPELERVSAIARLVGGGAEAGRAAARRLVPVLNEPLWWLGSEVLLALAAFEKAGAPAPLLGVDDRGMVVAGPTPDEVNARDEARDALDERGRLVVPHAQALRLVGRTSSPLAWAFVEPDGAAYLRVR